MKMLLVEIHHAKECLYLLKEKLQEGKFSERDFNHIEEHIKNIENNVLRVKEQNEKAISLISTI